MSRLQPEEPCLSFALGRFGEQKRYIQQFLLVVLLAVHCSIFFSPTATPVMNSRNICLIATFCLYL